jgi:hypothetical protein
MGLESMLEMTDADTALFWHLQFNHYPPLPGCVFGLAKQAIELANEGEWDARIDLTESGISWRGQKSAPVRACIEAWHLDGFLQDCED